MKFPIVLPALLAGALLLSCSSGPSPFSNPANAGFSPAQSLRSLDVKNDSVKVKATVPCTVQVYLPNLIDSFFVHASLNGSDSTLASGAITGNSFTFPFTENAPGVYKLNVVIVKSDSTKDTLSKTVTVYSMAPVVTADAPALRVFLPADSFVIHFTVTDPDSNVWKAFTWLDTATGASQQTSFSPKTHVASITKTVYGPSLIAALQAPIVCYAVAIDFPDSNVSKTAVCTLYVKDTVPPLVRIIPPTDTVNAVNSPVTIKALVTDFTGIDSVRYDNSPMVTSGDTAIFVASILDSGKQTDSIVAIDKAGNKTRFAFSLHIQGKQSVPPQIKDLSRATPQGVPFAPLFLDTCVIIADTSIKDTASFKKDSLIWRITDSAGTSELIPANHVFTIPFPSDTMWQGTFKLTFSVHVANSPSLMDTKQPSFFVTPFNYPPVITLAIDRCFKALRTDTIYLDAATTVHDPNDAATSLNWKFSKGNHFKVDSLYSAFLLKQTAGPGTLGSGIINPILPRFNRHIVIDTLTAADTAFFGTDSLTFTVTDPGGSIAAKKIYFTRPIGPCLFHL
jgi:hypothetical protein